jgi:hypothetical protein
VNAPITSEPPDIATHSENALEVVIGGEIVGTLH